MYVSTQKMASLRHVVKSKLPIFNIINHNKSISGNILIQKLHHNKDWKPGPYPFTKEQREAAAKKYNLIPEDYEPYSQVTEDHRGDYPKLPGIMIDDRDPYAIYDYPALRKNYGEPMHVDHEMLTGEKWNTEARTRYSHLKQCTILGSIIAGFTFLAIATEDISMAPPAIAKQLPMPGDVHYTFEPASSD